MWPFFNFSRRRPSAILDLFIACLDHTRSAVGSRYCCEKFGWNPHCSLEDMRLLMLCEFGLTVPIHAPFWIVFGKKWGKQMFYSFIPLRCNKMGLMSYVGAIGLIFGVRNIKIIADVIIRAKFWDNRFRGFGVLIPPILPPQCSTSYS